MGTYKPSEAAHVAGARVTVTRERLVAENEKLRVLLTATILDLQGIAEDAERACRLVTEELEKIDDRG